MTLNEVQQCKVLLVLFSAQFSPEARSLTKKLVDIYKSINGESGDKQLELIFVSNDKDKASFNQYTHDMPWAIIPFEDV
jgi:nucleoredoxin